MTDNAMAKKKMTIGQTRHYTENQRLRYTNPARNGCELMCSGRVPLVNLKGMSTVEEVVKQLSIDPS